MARLVPTPAAILRVNKLATFAALGSSAAHTWRTQPVPHADPERAHLNEDWRDVRSPVDLREAVKSRLAIADRQHPAAVICLEYLVTAPSAAFTKNGGTTDAVAYFQEALAFLEERHGANNLVGVNIQNDETTPHLVAYIVPLIERPASIRRRSIIVDTDSEGRPVRGIREFPEPSHVALSATHFVGSPGKLRNLQSEFAERVAVRHGLCRGLKHSAATHTTTREFHAALATACLEHLVLEAKDATRQGHLLSRESNSEMAARLSVIIRERYAPLVARAATAGHDRRRAHEMAETARRAQADLSHERLAHGQSRQRLERFTKGLSPRQIARFKEAAERWRLENTQRLREREAQRKKAGTVHRQAEQQREDGLAHTLHSMSATELAQLPEPVRRECWRLLFTRNDLAGAADRMGGSGLFDHAGLLSSKDQALRANTAETIPEYQTTPTGETPSFREHPQQHDGPGPG